MTTIENNKLLAEFMGLENEIFNTTLFYYTLDGCLDENSLKFHSDWNWLMEVVEKIYSLGGKNKPYYGITFTMHNDTFQFGLDNMTEKGLNKHISSHKNNLTRIQAVYNACIEFIKWYNENNPIN